METLVVVSVICIACACITAICKTQRWLLWQVLGVAFVAYAALVMTRSLAGLLGLPLAPSWLLALTAIGGAAVMFAITPGAPAPRPQEVTVRRRRSSWQRRADETSSTGD